MIRTSNKSQHTKLTLEKKNSPAASAGIRTRILSMPSTATGIQTCSLHPTRTLLLMWMDKAARDSEYTRVLSARRARDRSFVPAGTSSDLSNSLNGRVIWERGCSSVGRASDRHAADAGSISRCGKGFFSPRVNFRCRLAYGVRTPPCAIVCINICAHIKDPVVHVRVPWIRRCL